MTLTLKPDELRYFGVLSGRYGDLALTLHTFLWPFDGDLSRFVQREGAGMEFVSAAEMCRRTKPGGPDFALATGLENQVRLKMLGLIDER